ncbi:recombinase family protein [Silicimonas algicola]|uniref:YD repeat-containing protein n=1 Tax=Silicimonas algicola TaxID=1826607 RepID=A0A316G5L6_9RHOB|nr:recombinase family protein [Silicimonas algicola]AZQ68702.1 recombinase family protein [Silicimonas algicola]PWK56229.1 YD repeat-containing protein [Silicimonas algicola]
MRKIRCAIYTRKSSEDGLEQEFNSLHAQREACAAYILSQKHEGWVLLPEPYDDGGLSGGSLERPALLRLLDDIRAGRIDQIVVYKIDRLTRSLADFAKIVDALDAAGASFVSVTQSFNTATSMGRLTLNMLLSFAQFEREVTAERIRDKIAASKRRGLWMGGSVPLGYDPDGRTLKTNEQEAVTVRTIYDLYERLGTVREVHAEADRLNLRSRRRERSGGKMTGGGPFDRGHLHYILTNPLYAGRIRHRKKVYDGQHPPIIDPERWDAVQSKLQEDSARGRGRALASPKSHLCGKLFDETGDRLTPTHSRTRKGVRLRYYISHRLAAQSGQPHPGAWRLPAEELESTVATLLQATFSRQGFAATLAPLAPAETIAQAAAALKRLGADPDRSGMLALVERIDIAPGLMILKLDADSVAAQLAMDATQIDAAALSRSHPFQLRKRGVETRIVLADTPTGQDETLARNIARAIEWLERIKAGETFGEIADAEGTHKSRVQQIIRLAFLAPDIVRDVLDGRQPLGFTSEWSLRNELPSDWQEQRALLATL